MEGEAGSRMAGTDRKAQGLLWTAIGMPRRASRSRRLVVWALAGIVTGQLTGLVAKESKPARVVSGVVSDKAENPISGAVVTLTDLQDGKKTATYTGQSGTYQFSDLQITRDYEVQATYKGISSRVRKVSSIDPRNRIVLNLRIPPATEEE